MILKSLIEETKGTPQHNTKSNVAQDEEEHNVAQDDQQHNAVLNDEIIKNHKMKNLIGVQAEMEKDIEGMIICQKNDLKPLFLRKRNRKKTQ